ncbi:MAG: P-loop NTPase fold protein, partial [Planctomycetota bacterium]
MKKEEGPIGNQEEFITLLNNKDKSRERGFIVFVQGAVDLSPMEKSCFEQSWNSCLTARYSAEGGHVLFPLLAQFVDDIEIPGVAESMQQKSSIEEERPQVGAVTWDFNNQSEWLESLLKIQEHSQEGVNPKGDLESLERFFRAVDSSLDTGQRLVLLCEIQDLDENATLENIGFTEEVVKFFYEMQPERFGLVFSGIPEGIMKPLPDDRFRAIRVEEPGGGGPSPAPERNQPLKNDAAAGDDRLEIRSEVHALADAITANDMDPPLVVGVFGGWGSGKSFVLHLLQERLLKIRSDNLSDPVKRETFPYVGHPYLIQFDAWTYAKSNLWASLMQEVLVELNHQISMEKLLKDIDGENLLLGKKAKIWPLLWKLSPQEFTEMSETENGRKAIEMVAGLEAAKLEPDVLWTELQELRADEREELKTAEKQLAAKRKELAEKNGEIERDVDFQVTGLARQASFESFQDKLVGTLGKAVRDVLESKDLDAAVSLDEVNKTIKWVDRIKEGASKVTFTYLGFAILSAVAGLIVSEAGSIFGGSLGGIAGAILAVLDALKNANSWVEGKLDELDKM